MLAPSATRMAAALRTNPAGRTDGSGIGWILLEGRNGAMAQEGRGGRWTSTDRIGKATGVYSSVLSVPQSGNSPGETPASTGPASQSVPSWITTTNSITFLALSQP